ncbi:hypothetical protein H8S90_05705 [Olivibacter sp. SDN3]|uniref:TIM-barrel domain-containing protein n=1 Tax=Olivibacter sp. SDN3 TaxID=2764720 RepID=UPI0016516EBA|nr:TIM-barrel domain-containing protein [Olivibacter sp. SDN3]QNL51081.1 hypothetical protein H8S90_05705 [Olivibacter sp. SDN3]
MSSNKTYTDKIGARIRQLLLCDPKDLMGNFAFNLSMLICFTTNVQAQHPQTIELKNDQYILHIDTNTLNFGIQYHTTLIEPHPQGNLSFSLVTDTQTYAINKVRVRQCTPTLFRALVTNSSDLSAIVEIQLSKDFFMIKLTPENQLDKEETYQIDFRTAPLQPAYGLGDHGGFGENTAISNFVDDDFGNRDNEHRFISTFTIFPAHHFAQVLFAEQTKRVAITDIENRLGVSGVKSAAIYYFLGSPKQIYQTYRQVKIAEGYPDLKPKHRFFQLGYEAFGSLGWNTFQSSVENDISAYLEAGFPIKWAVVGSGFWRGERRDPSEGATTGFGLWDDSAGSGRKDGLPNPRYPNPQAFKAFFREREISLLLGLRINFKAPKAYGGYYEAENDGPFVPEGIDRGYFIRDKDERPETYRVNFPQGKVFLLEGKNPAAVNWYVSGADRWGVDGFKEDLMLYDGKKLNNDAKLNPVNAALMKKGYYIMARNSAYSLTGDILRLEDTKYGFDQDRPLINGLNYAASGVSTVYLDIVAGKYLENPLNEDQKRYFVRNAMAVAVSPVMAMGFGPWHLENSRYQKAVKKAADWHVAYADYLYSEALKSYHSGYPYTMTPLPIAFPDDTATYYLAGKKQRQYSWMLGESLLAIPLYGNDYGNTMKRDVYLPKGTWIDYNTGQCFEGPLTLKDYDFPYDKIPLFVGGKGVLVKEKDGGHQAVVYPTSKKKFTYIFYFPDGEQVSVIHKAFANWATGAYLIENQATGEIQEVQLESLHTPFTFDVDPGTDYLLTPKET